MPIAGQNPYCRLFYNGLAAHGIDFDDQFQLTPGWFTARRDQFDAVHFHWPEYLVRAHSPTAKWLTAIPGGWRAQSFLGRQSNLRCLLQLLQDCKQGGKRVIWTAHNLAPHGSRAARQAQQAYDAITASADLIVCHDQTAADAVQPTYMPQGKTVVMPHGNYDGAYPAARPVAEVRKAYGVAEDARLLVGVGILRRYKGMDIACEAIRGMKNPPKIIIAGLASEEDYVGELKSLSADNPHVQVEARSLTDQEFADLVTASDGVLLPYRKITGSGALLAALTLARGVITSDLPLFRNMLAEQPEAGELFAPGDVADCRRAILAYLGTSMEVRSHAARALADRFAWETVIQPVVDVIRAW